MIYTYDEVARTLPRDVVEAIEVSSPCAGGHDHLWDFYYVPYLDPSRYWACVYCYVVTHTDPRPPEARIVVSAHLEEFL